MYDRRIRVVQMSRLVAFLFVAVFLAGCSAAEQSVHEEERSIQEHEESFDPSDYRSEPMEIPEPPARENALLEEREATVWIERTERVMGYRVQLFSTTDIDRAQEALERFRQESQELQLDVGRLDMSYDAPYYKIRAGDFLGRKQADELRDALREAGIDDAWVVRDNVFHIVREEQKH
jgi:hypothetical protein